MRLVLVRHGKSAHTHRGIMSRSAVLEWRAHYDAAGILTEPRPSPELEAISRDAAVVASDLRRAVESAQRLTQRPIATSSLLREAPLPIPRWPTPLPLLAWDLMLTADWMARRAVGAERSGPDWERAGHAAAWLDEKGRGHDTTVVVIHGVIRVLIAHHLEQMGWSSASRIGGFDNWSYWSFTRE